MILELIVALMLIIILWLIAKSVIIPSISVTTDKGSYDRSETVAIGGVLADQGGTGIPSKTVAIAIEDPAGQVYPGLSAVTDSDGNYTATWEIPDDADGGNYTVSATALGISASKTFRGVSQRIVAILTV
ncbi:hypothetical protein LCGC14_2627120 [marine sediment metagenome]|uniref:Macroglobulin domain-containing protein n=1 Tax=marine sediment metagenome TaxID=412755 RepID=A0A0F9CTX4_9ZZZZ